MSDQRQEVRDVEHDVEYNGEHDGEHNGESVSLSSAISQKFKVKREAHQGLATGLTRGLITGIILGGVISSLVIWTMGSLVHRDQRSGSASLSVDQRSRVPSVNPSVKEERSLQASHELNSETSWTCSMHPQVQAPQAGTCPICGMDLILADQSSSRDQTSEGPDLARLELGERARRLARLKTSLVRLEALPPRPVELWGEVEVDEGARSTVSAWVGGRIERLRVSRIGERVKRGQTIGEIYSPALYQAHQALISAIKRHKGKRDAKPNVAERAATQRLRLLGVSAAELKLLRRAKRPWRRAPLRSDRDGVVLEVRAREGAYVREGEPLFSIADLDHVWVSLRAPASLLGELNIGDRFALSSTRASRGDLGAAELSLIEPLVSASSRVARLRLNVDQRQRPIKLSPGEVIRAHRVDSSVERTLSLTIPSSAPLVSEGGRYLVYIDHSSSDESGGGQYEARSVSLGPRIGNRYPVISGLKRGERVISRGAFTLDAEAQLRGVVSLMSPPTPHPSSHHKHPHQLTSSAREALASLLGAYLDLQERLAESDKASASRAIERGVQTLKQSRVALKSLATPQGLKDSWLALAPVIEHDLNELKRAQNLDVMRARFADLTRLMRRLLALFGNLTPAPIREASCPMAFSGAGGRWFQRASEVDNVYYGDEMRRCGVIERVIEQISAPMIAPTSRGEEAR